MKKKFVLTILFGLVLPILLVGLKTQSLDVLQQVPYRLKGAQDKRLYSIKSTQDQLLILNKKVDDQYLLENQNRYYNISLTSGQYLVLLEVEQYLGEKSVIDLIIQMALDKQFSNVISSTDSYGLKGDERCIFNVSSPCDVYVKVTSVAGYGSYSIIVSDDINEGYIPLSLDSEEQGGVSEENYRVYYIDNLIEGEYKISVQPTSFLDLVVSISFDPLFTINKISDKSGFGVGEEINVKTYENHVLYIRINSKSGNSNYAILISKVDNSSNLSLLIPLTVIISILAILATISFLVLSKSARIYFYNHVLLPYNEKRERSEKEVSEIISSDQQFSLLRKPKAIFPEELPFQLTAPINDTEVETISPLNVSASVITFSLKDGLKTCPICRKSILETDKSKECPVCKVPFHFEHFVKWVIQNGFCPECNERIALEKKVEHLDLEEEE